MQLNFVDAVICLSVVLLGAFIAFEVRVPVMIGASVVGLFAFFHGHAHGAEAMVAELVPYSAGFTSATVALLAAGIGAGLCARSFAAGALVRTTGACAALIGLSLFGGLA